MVIQIGISKTNLKGNFKGVSFLASSNILTITTSEWNSVNGFLIGHGYELEKF